MIVREIFTRMGIKWDDKSAKKANSGLANIKSAALKLAGVFAAGKIVRGLQNAVDKTRALGDEIDKTSGKLGIQSDAWQELAFAAGQSGVAKGTLALGLQTLSRVAEEASRGVGEGSRAFKDLGVSATDSNGKLKDSPVLLAELADKLKEITPASKRTALAMKLFGARGTAMLNMTKDGSAGIAKMREEAQALGGVLDKDLVRMTVELTDQQGRLNEAYQGIRNIFAKSVIPFLLKAGEGTLKWIKANREWLRQNISKAVKQIGTAFERVGTAIKRVIDWFADLGPHSKTILKVGLAVAALAIAFSSPVIAALALGAAIFAVIEDLETFSTTGQGAFGDISDSMVEWMEQFPGLYKMILGLETPVDNMLKAVGIAIDEMVQMISASFIFLGETMLAPLKLIIAVLRGDIDAAVDAVVGPISRLTDRFGSSFTALTGGVPTPTPTASTSTSSSNAVSQTNQMSMTVNAAPGQDAREIASTALDMMEQRQQQSLRMTLDDMTFAQ